MSKALWFVAALVILGGCAISEDHSQSATEVKGEDIVVAVQRNGDITEGNWVLSEASLPAFAKETGTRRVVVMAGTSMTDFSMAVRARDELKSAGVANVSIGN
ncbi:MAG: hypothetical protein ABSD28_09585 [Tepidisphaeraceae bacterium]|jgi:biopolymer transport protein ExbD